jgi:hypothetical protein
MPTSAARIPAVMIVNTIGSTATCVEPEPVNTRQLCTPGVGGRILLAGVGHRRSIGSGGEHVDLSLQRGLGLPISWLAIIAIIRSSGRVRCAGYRFWAPD